MTKEQCIEIAEKVWGWEHDDNWRWRGPNGEYVGYGDLFCGYEVNSWQGFGRTVEGMAREKYHLEQIVGACGTRYFRFIRVGSPPLFGNQVLAQSDTPIYQNIKEAHLAALEVLKDG